MEFGFASFLIVVWVFPKYMYVCMYVCIFMCIYVCICMYMYVYVCMCTLVSIELWNLYALKCPKFNYKIVLNYFSAPPTSSNGVPSCSTNFSNCSSVRLNLSWTSLRNVWYSAFAASSASDSSRVYKDDHKSSIR